MRQPFAALITAASLSFQPAEAQETNLQPNHPYAGMWVTDDNRVRQELLPSGRYVEPRGERERAMRAAMKSTGRISSTGTTRASLPTVISLIPTYCTMGA